MPRTAFTSARRASSWEAALRKSREAKGAVASRKVVHAKYTKSSYSDPGSFVEIQFETRFESGVHRIGERDPFVRWSWKVSSYRIR